LRVVHVVTYVSKYGSFGGPTAVAISQLSALAREGHHVELVAGWDGRGVIDIPGVKISLFKAIKLWPGFTGIISPHLFVYLFSTLKPGDKLHIHLGRDLITLTASAIGILKSIEYIVQTHGMVMPKKSRAVRFLDVVITQRVLQNAKRVLVLTNEEFDGIRHVKGSADRVIQIANGIADTKIEYPTREMRSILFLARLHPRKRVLAFVEMCRLLVDEGIEFKAEIIGPDEGDLPRVKAAIRQLELAQSVSYEGPLRQGAAVDRLASSGVYVLPSFGEVFPMTVLEALVARTPVVTTDQSGLAALLEERHAAIITDGSPRELMLAVKRIFDDNTERELLVENGLKALKTTFSIDAIADQLIKIYQDKNENQSGRDISKWNKQRIV
jgi:glycosyltransferase involved in cell wall biosynthesis